MNLLRFISWNLFSMLTCGVLLLFISFISHAQIHSWQTSSPLQDGYIYPGSATLPSGKILVVGGYTQPGVVYSSNAYIFDPTTELWTQANSMPSPHRLHALKLTTDEILVVGEDTPSSPPTGYLYSEITDEWIITGVPSISRYSSSLTLLSSGEVLLAGGYDGTCCGSTYKTAEIYNRTSNQWTTTEQMIQSRAGHSATLLQSTKVLVAGGAQRNPYIFRNSAELFDPQTGAWSLTSSMHFSRLGHTATLLLSGKVLVIGGFISSDGDEKLTTTRTVEIYDPNTGIWTDASPMCVPRARHTATILPSGLVIVCGGSNQSGPLNLTEIYNPNTNEWLPGPEMNQKHSDHITALLSTEKLLVACGLNISSTGTLVTELAAIDTIPANFQCSYDSIKYRTFSLSTNVSVKPNKLNKAGKPAVVPNVANWRDTAIARYGGKSGLVLGIPQTDKNTAKNFGWVRFKKGADFGKFYTELQTNAKYNAPFDTVRKEGSSKKKRFIKEVMISSKTYTNPFVQAFGLFKLNLASSIKGVTPTGFDSLIYVSSGSPWNGSSLMQISNYVDTVLTYYKSKPLFDSTFVSIGDSALETLRLVLNNVNSAFDTTILLSNGDSISNGVLKLKGLIEISSVDYLMRTLSEKQTTSHAYSQNETEPSQFALLQNYPNPFNPQTAIGFSLLDAGNVSLKVYDVLGQEVATLLDNELMEAGVHELQFDASRLSSGVYFYRLNVQGENGVSFVQTKKMVLMK